MTNFSETKKEKTILSNSTVDKKENPSRTETGRPAGKFGDALDFAAREAYNSVRTNLQFTLPNRSGGRIVGVTSPCPQEGKSYTSINLSYALAKDGNRVLLIDADLRRPSLAKSLGLKRVPGLSNLISGGASEPTIHHGVLHENLDMMMAGDIPPNPSELLGSSSFEERVRAFAEQYDYVMIDLPPVMSVIDPVVVATKVLDGIIVVMRHKETRRKNVYKTVAQLEFAQAHILGFVYNGYNGEGGYYRGGRYKYRKYGRYRNYYRYYSSHSADADKEKNEKAEETATEKKPEATPEPPSENK